MALDVPKRIFAVLYVSVMGLTLCYKTTVFLHLLLYINYGVMFIFPQMNFYCVSTSASFFAALNFWVNRRMEYNV